MATNNTTGIRGATFQVTGLQELQAQFRRIGKMPKKYLTKAAREGMADPLREARANAPVGKNTSTRGSLKKSIKKKQETPNKRNKAVYRLRYDPKYNDVFQKPTTGVYGGETPHAYYPNSVEYGFKTKKGRVAGKYHMTKVVKKNEKESTQKVIDSLNDSLTQLLN